MLGWARMHAAHLFEPLAVNRGKTAVPENAGTQKGAGTRTSAGSVECSVELTMHTG
jgi:hypothetical protein